MKKINLGERFMMFSNIFLILPVLFAAIYHQWLYFFFASGLFIFSPLFHWYQITNRSSTLFQVFKTFDWLFAISAFIYMYYYIYRYTGSISQLSLYFSLSLIVIFFWYGWRQSDYHKWHPWFHIIAPIVSSAILIVAN